MAETHSDTATQEAPALSGIDAVLAEEQSAEQSTGTEIPSADQSEAEGIEAETQTEGTEQTGEATTETAEAQVKAEPEPELLKFFEKKGVSREDFEKYAERYQKTPEQLKADPQLKYLLLDKINADKALETKKQPVEEAKKDEQNPSADLTKHFDSIVERTSKLNDPKALGEVARRLAAIPNDDPQYAEKQLGILAAAQLSFMETALPQMFQQLMQSQFGGLVEQHTNIQAYKGHEKAYNDYASSLRDEFPDLPAFGGEGYAQLANNAKLLVPNIESAAFTPEDRMKIVLNLAVGRKAEAEKTKAVVTQAAEAGRRQGTQAQQAATLGKGLGAGQSNKNFGSAKKGNDDIFDEGVAEYRRRDKS